MKNLQTVFNVEMHIINYILFSVRCSQTSLGERPRQKDDLKDLSTDNMPQRKRALVPVNTRRRVKADDYFPFNSLPVECQLHVLSFLSEVDKCNSALVCASWSCLVRSGKLWRVCRTIPAVGCFIWARRVCSFPTESLSAGRLGFTITPIILYPVGLVCSLWRPVLI